MWVRALEGLSPDAIRARISELRRVAPTAPVLLVTSIADQTIAPDANGLGIDHVVFEPVRRSGVRSILHGLQDVASSRPGETLPRAPAPTPTPVHPQVGPVSVLVVDDNPVNRKVAALMCQRLGHRVEAVASGEAAIEAVCRGSSQGSAWDVVLMDVMMPGISGIDAALRIRAALERPPTIFALSASDDASQRQECHQAGMAAHLKKPLTVDDLRRALVDHLAPPARNRRDTVPAGGPDDGESSGVDVGSDPARGV